MIPLIYLVYLHVSTTFKNALRRHHFLTWRKRGQAAGKTQINGIEGINLGTRSYKISPVYQIYWGQKKKQQQQQQQNKTKWNITPNFVLSEKLLFIRHVIFWMAFLYPKIRIIYCFQWLTNLLINVLWFSLIEGIAGNHFFKEQVIQFNVKLLAWLMRFEAYKSFSSLRRSAYCFKLQKRRDVYVCEY